MLQTATSCRHALRRWNSEPSRETARHSSGAKQALGALGNALEATFRNVSGVSAHKTPDLISYGESSAHHGLEGATMSRKTETTKPPSKAFCRLGEALIAVAGIAAQVGRR